LVAQFSFSSTLLPCCAKALKFTRSFVTKSGFKRIFQICRSLKFLPRKIIYVLYHREKTTLRVYDEMMRTNGGEVQKRLYLLEQTTTPSDDDLEEALECGASMVRYTKFSY
jgi:hypothetical protein